MPLVFVSTVDYCAVFVFVSILVLVLLFKYVLNMFSMFSIFWV